MDKFTIVPSKASLSFRPKKGKRPASASDTEGLPPKRPQKQSIIPEHVSTGKGLIHSDLTTGLGRAMIGTSSAAGPEKEKSLEELLNDIHLFSEKDLPPFDITTLPPLPGRLNQQCTQVLEAFRGFSMDELAPMMCLAAADMGIRYQRIREKLAAHEVLRELARASLLRATEDNARIPELEQKLKETEETLRTALAEVDRLKEKELLFDRSQDELKEAQKLIDELNSKLREADAEKERALLQLKDRYSKQIDHEIQEAFNMGYSKAVEKYNIQISEAEEDEEHDPEQPQPEKQASKDTPTVPEL